VKIFVISLSDATERRCYVLEQFRRAGLSFSFFDAIRGDGICLHDHFDGIDRTTYRLNTYRDPLPSEVGCFASHRALWRLSAESREPLLILEDDCELYAEFESAAPLALSLANELGYVRLESVQRSVRPRLSARPRRISAIRSSDVHYLSDVPLCLVAYAIGPDAAARLVDASRTLSSPVDKFVQRTWEHGVPVFAMTPPPVGSSHCARRSTIGDRSQKHRDLSWMMRRAGYKAMSEIRRMTFNREQLNRWCGDAEERSFGHRSASIVK
jgi:glycosyl transferase family 25